MPGGTGTVFFDRAEMFDTGLGGSDDKADPAEVAPIGYEAMMKGEAEVVTCWKNKLVAALSNVIPDEKLARQHAKTARPGSAGEAD